jgi:hypothetical protein
MYNTFEGITTNELKWLMESVLNYHFLQYKGIVFKQKDGIAMGSNDSVSIANITVEKELRLILSNPLFIYHGRFIDDLFIILEIPPDQQLDAWLNKAFQHEYLKFTFEHNLKTINFLDVQVSLDQDNEISTELYHKPISKHQYVHFKSNHPKHLLKSLPYSALLRIKRIHSNADTLNNALLAQLSKFRTRGYPESVLQEALNKLQSKSRADLLIPKTTFLINYLEIHNPIIFDKFDKLIPCKPQYNKLYAVFPFYNNITNYSLILKEVLCSYINSRNQVSQRLRESNVCVSFSVGKKIIHYF